jgi:tetratricopeptide (TPR) repeat protein
LVFLDLGVEMARDSLATTWLRFLVSCALALPLAGPTSAIAQSRTDSEAKALFAAGREAFDAGRYDAALARWQEAYDLSKRPALQYNLGLVHDRLRHDDQALAAFRAYLAQVPDAENREEVEGRIREPPQNDVALTSADAHDQASKPLMKQWWFWTGIGVVVVGGVVAAVAVASSGDKQAGPIDSRSGITIMALGSQ